MFIEQVSVFLENKPGKLADVIKIIGENHIDIYALSIADTADFGILRLIVSDPQKTKEIIKSKGMIVKCTNVIAATVEDKPGGLINTLDILINNEISIEYIYAFIGKNQNGANVVLRVDKPDKAIELFKQADVKVIDANQLYR